MISTSLPPGIRARIAERLEWLGVAEGSRVKAGDIIARIDARDVVAQGQSAQANVTAAKANAKAFAAGQMLAVLDSGQFAGATLDVFREEPLPPHHRFWKHPAITITPHISAITLRAESVLQIAERMRALENGLPVDGVVDIKRGY